jgi:hypothetical protein
MNREKWDTRLSMTRNQCIPVKKNIRLKLSYIPCVWADPTIIFCCILQLSIHLTSGLCVCVCVYTCFVCVCVW